jgi:tRNA threonylcarbamoyladenosine biosynthesis protein TsaE
VEWADRVAECLPAERLAVTLEVTGETARRVRLEGNGEPYADLVRRLAAGEGPRPSPVAGS